MAECEAGVSQKDEPPCPEFTRRIGKHNVYRQFQKHLAEGNWYIPFTDWSEFDHFEDDENDFMFRPDESINCRNRKIIYERIIKMRDRFNQYCKQLIILGFNNSKYDFQLGRAEMVKHLYTRGGDNCFVIKRNNAYASIVTDKFRILDVINYLQQGTSYAQFLKSYHCSMSKGWFPYEFFDSESKLDYPALPPIHCFYSELKGFNVLEEEKLQYDKLLGSGKRVEEALKLMGLENPPLSKEENYSHLQQVWSSHQMRVFGDFLRYYNILDVVPFVEGVEKMLQFYVGKGLDLFKQTISVPGVSRFLLNKSSQQAKIAFPLITADDKQLYWKLKNGLVGGPSIVFNRFVKVGETKVRGEDSPLVESIEGYDCSGLYLNSMAQALPSSYYVRRQAADNFTAKYSQRHRQMFDWMDYLMERDPSLNIRHMVNNGKEVKIGSYSVDGYDEKNGIVFDFQGCWWHSHFCVKIPQNEKGKVLYYKRRERTQLREQFLKSLGFKIVVIWECDYNQQLKTDPMLEHFVRNREKWFQPLHMTQQSILDKICDNTLFGCIECDLEVPEEWGKKHRGKFSESPYEYFEEFPPIFCTSEIPFDCWGPLMQSYVVENHLSQNPKTLLVGGMKASHIYLITPLVKWYIEHGLVVTKVYEIVQFKPGFPFRQFVQQVTEARRQGDRDSKLDILSNTMKLIGNSGYGSLIRDVTKETNVKFVQGHSKASAMVNKSAFKKLTVLDDDQDYFEVESTKGCTNLNLPIILGFFILGYAKLRMCQFYFDFLKKYVSRNMFSIIQMDTDSLYFALGAKNLTEAIKSEMKKKYDLLLKGNCNKQTTKVLHNTKQEYWFPRTCCIHHSNYDKRESGLFHLEFSSGQEMCSLASKTYALKGKNTEKFSCKGINKKRVHNVLDICKSVLKTKRSVSSVNKGFRLRGNKILTYSQIKFGFSYFYVKRIVCNDGIHTKPLKMVLVPRKIKCSK
jgi:hypothetical protein